MIPFCRIKESHGAGAGGDLGSQVLTGATRGWAEVAAGTRSRTGIQVLAPGPEHLCSKPVFVYAHLRAYTQMLLSVHPGSLTFTPDHKRLAFRPPNLLCFQVRLNDSESFVEHCGVFSCCGNLNRRAWDELSLEKATSFTAKKPHTHTASLTWANSIQIPEIQFNNVTEVTRWRESGSYRLDYKIWAPTEKPPHSRQRCLKSPGCHAETQGPLSRGESWEGWGGGWPEPPWVTVQAEASPPGSQWRSQVGGESQRREGPSRSNHLNPSFCKRGTWPWGGIWAVQSHNWLVSEAVLTSAQTSPITSVFSILKN